VLGPITHIRHLANGGLPPAGPESPAFGRNWQPCHPPGPISGPPAPGLTFPAWVKVPIEVPIICNFCPPLGLLTSKSAARDIERGREATIARCAHRHPLDCNRHSGRAPSTTSVRLPPPTHRASNRRRTPPPAASHASANRPAAPQSLSRQTHISNRERINGSTTLSMQPPIYGEED